MYKFEIFDRETRSRQMWLWHSLAIFALIKCTINQDHRSSSTRKPFPWYISARGQSVAPRKIHQLPINGTRPKKENIPKEKKRENGLLPTWKVKYFYNETSFFHAMDSIWIVLYLMAFSKVHFSTWYFIADKERLTISKLQLFQLKLGIKQNYFTLSNTFPFNHAVKQTNVFLTTR